MWHYACYPRSVGLDATYVASSWTICVCLVAITGRQQHRTARRLAIGPDSDMNVVIRLANIEADRNVLQEAISKWLSPRADAARFDWLYLGCPHGPARVLIAVDGARGTLVGAAAAFPRRLYVSGSPKEGCVLGDFFVVPEYRSVGPAVQLQRACLSMLSSEAFHAYYDLPAATMVPVYKRLFIEPRDRLVRMAKPLRADRKIRERIKLPVVARGVRAAANQVLKIKNRASAKPHICQIAIQENGCGEEFDALARSCSETYGVCTQRTAAYLNWRYRNHFARRFQMLVARRRGRLLAYCVFACEGEDAEIVDLFGVNESSVLIELTKAAAAHAYRQGAITVSANVLASHPSVQIFEKLGFRGRESCPVMHSCPALSGTTQGSMVSNWFLMGGDRES
jgi:GNAT superfamily N-acetyltransferase